MLVIVRLDPGLAYVCFLTALAWARWHPPKVPKGLARGAGDRVLLEELGCSVYPLFAPVVAYNGSA